MNSSQKNSLLVKGRNKMAAKKKAFHKRKLDPTTESVAIASAFSVLFLVFIKVIIIAIPLGILFALAHHQGIRKKKK